MSGRHWRSRIEDILDALTEIQSFVAGATLEQFTTDAKTLKAVAADLHVYFDVDPGILWDTVQHDLPKLIEPLKKLLD